MSISLFEHNQKAYDSAVAMLAETGKAAVIHPTGMGKSFIGFKLCEDNLDSFLKFTAGLTSGAGVICRKGGTQKVSLTMKRQGF